MTNRATADQILTDRTITRLRCQCLTDLAGTVLSSPATPRLYPPDPTTPYHITTCLQCRAIAHPFAFDKSRRTCDSMFPPMLACDAAAGLASFAPLLTEARRFPPRAEPATPALPFLTRTLHATPALPLQSYAFHPG